MDKIVRKYRSIWSPEKAYLLLGTLFAFISLTLTAHALVTVSNSGLFGDADVLLDSSGTLNLGTASSTAVVIGSSTTPVMIPGALAVNGTLTLGSASTTGQLLFRNASSSFTTILQASPALTSDLTFTLPNATGTPGQVLSTDGAGGLYFANASTSTPSQWVNGPNGAISYNGGTVSVGQALPDGAPANSAAIGGGLYGDMIFGASCANGTVPTYNSSTKVYVCAATSNTANVVTGATSLATATWVPYVTGAGTIGTATTHGGPRVMDNVNSPNTLNGWAGNSIDSHYVGGVIAGGGQNTSENKLLCSPGSPQHCTNTTISGGYDNQIDDAYPSVISGGAHNRINIPTTSAGGYTNPIPGFIATELCNHATIGGGTFNAMFNCGSYATIAGGSQNSIGPTVISGQSTISGGLLNVADGTSLVIGGGSGNHASGDVTVIGGGYHNTTSGTDSVVSGGSGNTASADYSMVPGGLTNTAGGRFSLAFGRLSTTSQDYGVAIGYQAVSSAVGAWALSDSISATFTNSTANSFKTRFSGGYYFSGGAVQADGYKSSDGTAGFTGTCAPTTTITVKNGLITGCN